MSGSKVARLHLVKLATIAAAYYASAKLGLDLAGATSSVTAIWPPTGIALAALLLWGPRMWPGVALGALLANAWTGVPLVTVLGITIGNTLEAAGGAALLRRVDFRPTLERVRDVLLLVALGAFVSTTISATIGVSSLILGDEVASEDALSVWRVWWLGDLGGDLLVAPLLLVAARAFPFEPPGRVPEALALVAALVGAAILVFGQETDTAYLLFPLLIWAALRFWQPGAVVASLLVAVMAVVYTADEMGPFVTASQDDSLLRAQLFSGVAGMTALVLGTIVGQRRRAEQAAERIAATLQESLLPSAFPEVPGVEIATRFRPAGVGERVGGDFYDLFDVDDGWAVVVGDVCGKGPAAAAVTALARYTLRAAAMHVRAPSAVLEELNEAMLRQRGDSEFCSVGYLLLEPHSGGASATLASGGHPLPLLLHGDGRVETVGRPGLILGIEPRAGLVDEPVELAPGDTLVLYTDGLTDAHAPAHGLTDADLSALLATCAGASAAETARRLEAAALAAGPGDPRDDIAIVVLRV